MCPDYFGQEDECVLCSLRDQARCMPRPEVHPRSVDKVLYLLDTRARVHSYGIAYYTEEALSNNI